MRYREHSPHPCLKNHIRCYWTLKICEATPPCEWLQFLAESVEFTFKLSAKNEFMTEDMKTAISPQCCIYGPMAHTMRLKPLGDVKMFGICFRPGGTRPFFSSNLSEFVNKSVEICDLWGSTSSEFVHRIRYDCETTEERIDYLNHYFLRRLDQKNSKNNSISVAVKVIEAHKGQVKIDDLAGLIGLSRRQLERKFKAYVGLSPKQFCRSLRFKSILKRIETSPIASWAVTASACGYFDQSHMINDFRHFTGTSPAAYIATPRAMEGYFTGNF